MSTDEELSSLFFSRVLILEYKNQNASTYLILQHYIKYEGVRVYMIEILVILSQLAWYMYTNKNVSIYISVTSVLTIKYRYLRNNLIYPTPIHHIYNK